MNEPLTPGPSPSDKRPSPTVIPKKRWNWLPVFLYAGVFLLGFAPMWLKSSRLAGELNRAQTTLRLETIQLALATAALDARRGDYESARKGTANFFTLVRTELDRGIASAVPVNARAELQALLAQRDDLITLLARGDGASGERLAEVHRLCRRIFRGGG